MLDGELTCNCHACADIRSGHTHALSLSQLHCIHVSLSHNHTHLSHTIYFTPLTPCLVSSLYGRSYCPRRPASTTSSVLRILLPGRQVKCSLFPLDSAPARSLSPGFLSSEFHALNPVFSVTFLSSTAPCCSVLRLCPFSLCGQ